MDIHKITNFIFLHLCILIYTATTITSKYASMHDFLSWQYIIFIALTFLLLGVYAIVWQQSIKNFSPSVAYSNKSVTTVWALIFSSVLFNEGITLTNIIGAVMIVAGVIWVADDE